MRAAWIHEWIIKNVSLNPEAENGRGVTESETTRFPKSTTTITSEWKNRGYSVLEENHQSQNPPPYIKSNILWSVGSVNI